MARTSLRLQSSPKFLSANSCQAVSLANLGISGDAAHTAFVFYRSEGTGNQCILAVGAASGAGAGFTLRVTGASAVDLNISGIGSVPAALSYGMKGRWCSLGMSKSAGSSPWLLYANGIAVNGSGSLSVNLTNAPVYIGVNQSGSERFNGNISLVCIWDSVLTGAQMLSLHNQGLAALASLPTPKLLYRMDDGLYPFDTRMLYDGTVNANHAKLTGTHWVGGEAPFGERGLTRIPNSFSELPLGAMALYEADKGITMDGSNRVSQWNDFSGAGAHLVQATSGNQPLWVDLAINNRPALRITNARADFMAATNGIFGGGARPHTIACVVKAESGGLSAFQGFFALGSGDSNGNSSSLGVDNANLLWYGGAGYGTPTVAQTYTSGQTYIMVKRSSGYQDTIWLNGVMRGSAVQIGAYAITPVGDILFGKYTASYTSANFLCAFLGAWNRDLSDNEVMALNNYLSNRYGVGSTFARSAASGRSSASSRSAA